MANPYFSFRQFTIYQDRCAMKVGTDGVLLGAWAGAEGTARIVDAGAGTGLVAIMMAQRSVAIVDAVEIDPEACVQARENAEACPWKDRITIYHDSIQHFASRADQPYDLVISNPPYFRNSMKPPIRTRSLARHDDRLESGALLQASDQLLHAEGRLAVIIPAAEINSFIEKAYFFNLHLHRRTLVRAYPGRAPSRCLAELGRWRKKPEMNELVIRQSQGTYSTGYRKLVEEYYLNM